RWFTEAILRGLNKFACDPNGDDRCPTKVRKNNQEIAQYCTACLIFGATGMRRLFRIEIDGGKKVFDGGAINIKPDGRNRGWYLGSGLIETINFKIAPLNKDFDENLVFVPLAIATKWGGLGAKTQVGYGVVEFENYPEIKFEIFNNALSDLNRKERLENLNVEERSGKSNSLPNIKEMFFAKIQFEANGDWWKEVDGIKKRGNRNGYINDSKMQKWIDSGSVPIAPAIKNWLRFGNGKNIWQTGNNKNIENWLFGSTKRVCANCYTEVNKDKNNPQNFWCTTCKKSLKDKETFERTSSKINISCAYRIDNYLSEFRIWGWIPKNNLPNGFNRDSFLNNLKVSLDGSGSVKIPWDNLFGSKTQKHRLKVWREFYSPTGTVKANKNDINEYLQNLLKVEE
ncbi:MAG: RAMP superfamily CRISPR-associated protein, partial [Thermodesulfobacteriota bacterium]